MKLGASRPARSKLLSSLGMWDEMMRLTGNENQADSEQMRAVPGDGFGMMEVLSSLSEA